MVKQYWSNSLKPLFMVILKTAGFAKMKTEVRETEVVQDLFPAPGAAHCDSPDSEGLRRKKARPDTDISATGGSRVRSGRGSDIMLRCVCLEVLEEIHRARDGLAERLDRLAIRVLPLLSTARASAAALFG